MNISGLEQKARRTLILQLIAVVSASGALKLFYSRASANELRWILAPTARLVELVTGVDFEFEPYAGYMSAGRTYLIATACAGINFLIAAFLMLSLRKLWRERTGRVHWRYFPIAALASYAATIIANTIRISISVWLNSVQDDDWFAREQYHRFEGIIIYFGCLLALFLIAEKVDSPREPQHGRPQRNFGWAVFPLTAYYGLTIGIPLANGAYRQGAEFWRHAAIVALMPLIMISVVAIFRAMKDPPS